MSDGAKAGEEASVPNSLKVPLTHILTIRNTDNDEGKISLQSSLGESECLMKQHFVMVFTLGNRKCKLYQHSSAEIKLFSNLSDVNVD